jgi:hypothetical protein
MAVAQTTRMGKALSCMVAKGSLEELGGGWSRELTLYKRKEDEREMSEEKVSEEARPT